MNTYTDFSQALADFRQSGGAMTFSPAHFNRESDTWYVGATDEIQEMSEANPYFCTENALFAGGLTPDEITVELRDWED